MHSLMQVNVTFVLQCTSRPRPIRPTFNPMCGFCEHMFIVFTYTNMYVINFLKVNSDIWLRKAHEKRTCAFQVTNERQKERTIA